MCQVCAEPHQGPLLCQALPISKQRLTASYFMHHTLILLSHSMALPFTNLSVSIKYLTQRDYALFTTITLVTTVLVTRRLFIEYLRYVKPIQGMVRV